MTYPLKMLVATTIQSASTSPSAWTKLHSPGSSRSTKTQSMSGTTSRLSSPANFTGAMGRSGTRMDLAMVKQEQGDTLRQYMRCFFDKRATVVNITDKEVIDLFQDGLYHSCTF
jgi:hypothetical protein